MGKINQKQNGNGVTRGSGQKLSLFRGANRKEKKRKEKGGDQGERKEKEKKGREKKAFNISEVLASCFCTQRPCWRGQCGWALWGAAASSRDAGTVRRLGHGAGTRAGRDGWRRGARSDSHVSSTLQTPSLNIFISLKKKKKRYLNIYETEQMNLNLFPCNNRIKSCDFYYI